MYGGVGEGSRTGRGSANCCRRKKRGEAVSLGQSGEKKFGFGLLLRLGPGLNMTEAVSVQERVLGRGWSWGEKKGESISDFLGSGNVDNS